MSIIISTKGEATALGPAETAVTELGSPSPRSRRLVATAVVAALALGSLLGVAAPANAAGYAVMTVQAGAAARWDAGVYTGSFAGWVTSDGWINPNGQRSWVRCYRDGGWATGNYSSNRWFLAYVNTAGRQNPLWLYVHSSYVTNQSGVPRC